MHGLAVAIDGHGDRHVLHFELVDRFHAQLGEGQHLGLLDCLGDQVGGAAYLVSQAIKKSTVLAFPELGMEAIYEFEVKDMPVTVAVDTKGESVHITGPAIWQKKIHDSLAVEIK